jgi:hypothetical protein
MSNKTFIAFVNLVDKYEKTLNELDDPELMKTDKLFAMTMADFKEEFISYWLLIEQYSRLKVFGTEEEMFATLSEMQKIIDKKNEPVQENFV